LRKYLQSIGLAWTALEVGWWMSGMFPYPVDFVSSSPFISEMYKLYGGGDVLTAATDDNDVTRMIPLILADSRTENQVVFGCAEDLTQADVWALAREYGFKDGELEKKTVHVRFS
jgi:hypothetical protein